MSNNLKEEWESNLVQTFKALNLIDENKENVNENFDEQICFPTEEQENVAMNVKAKQRDPIIDQLLKEMTLMRNQIQILGGSNNRLNEQTTQSDLINSKTGQSWKRYCWSCGCCVHWGKNCPNKKKGQKVEATFRNRMNGSSTNCL